MLLVIACALFEVFFGSVASLVLNMRSAKKKKKIIHYGHDLGGCFKPPQSVVLVHLKGIYGYTRVMYGHIGE